jgi:hypothetical protein
MALVTERINKLQVDGYVADEGKQEQEDAVKSDEQMNIADLFVLRARIHKHLGHVCNAKWNVAL